MRKVFNTQVSVSQGAIIPKPDQSGPFARRTPVAQLFQEKVAPKKRYAYDSFQNNEFTRAQRSLGAKKRHMDRFHSKNTELYNTREMTQNLNKFEGFGAPSNNLRSKTREIADKIKGKAKQRLSSPPMEGGVESRQRKVSYLMDLLNKRNAITDPNSKKSKMVEVVSQSQRWSARSNTNKDVIVSLNTTNRGLIKVPSERQSTRSLQIGARPITTQPIVGQALVPSQSMKPEPTVHQTQPMIMVQQQNSSKEILALPAPIEKTVSQLKREMKQIQNQFKEPQSLKTPIVVDEGYQSGDVDNAFMTQCAQKDGVLLEELKDENLKVSMTKNAKKKSRTIKKQEKGLSKVLKYLGIKDKYMMDHFYPEFHAALERKIEARLKKDQQEKQALNGGHDVAKFNMDLVRMGEAERYKWVELYDQKLVDPNRLNTGERARKMISRKAFLNEDFERRKDALEKQKQPKRLKICKFDEEDLNRMFKKEKMAAREEMQLIQYNKAQKQVPYMERVDPAAVPENPCKSKQVTQLAVKRLHVLSQQILDALTEERRKKGLLDEEYYLAAKSELEEMFNPAEFVDLEFQRLDIEDLKDYIAQSMKIASHVTDQDDNKVNQPQPSTNEIISINESGISKAAVPSYKERIAFLTDMKKKWKVQKGYCSVFERARADRVIRMRKRQQRQDWIERRKFKRKVIAQALLKFVEERKFVANVPQEKLQGFSKPRSKSTLDIDSGRNNNLHTDSQQQLGSTARIGEQHHNMTESQLAAFKAQMQKEHGLLRDSGEAVILPRESFETEKFIPGTRDSKSPKLLVMPQQMYEDPAGFEMGMTELMRSGDASIKGGISPKSLYDWAKKQQAREFESRQIHRTQLDRVVKKDLENLERIVKHDNDDLDVMHPQTQLTVGGSQLTTDNNGTMLRDDLKLKENLLTIKGSAIDETKYRTRMASAAQRNESRSKKFTTQTLSFKEATMQTQNIRDSLASNKLKGDEIEKILQQNQKKIVLQRSLSHDKVERAKKSDLSSVVLSPNAKVDLIGGGKAEIFQRAKDMEASFNQIIGRTEDQRDLGLEPQASLVSRQSPILIHSTMQSHNEVKDYMKKTQLPSKVVVNLQEPNIDPLVKLKELQGLAKQAEKQVLAMKPIEMDYRKVHPEVAFEKPVPKSFPQRTGQAKRSKDITKLQARNIPVESETVKTVDKGVSTPPEAAYDLKQVHNIPASVATEVLPQSPGTALKATTNDGLSPFNVVNKRQQLSSDETFDELAVRTKDMAVEGKAIEIDTKGGAKSPFGNNTVSPDRSSRVRIASVVEQKQQQKQSSQALIQGSQVLLGGSVATQQVVTGAYYEETSIVHGTELKEKPSETKDTQAAQSARFRDHSKIYLHDGFQMVGSRDNLKVSTQNSVRKSNAAYGDLARNINQDSQASLQDKPLLHKPMYSQNELNSDLNAAPSGQPYTTVDSARGSKVIQSFDTDNLPKALPPQYHPMQKNVRMTSALKKELDRPSSSYGVKQTTKERKFSPVSRALEISNSLEKEKYDALRQNKMIHGRTASQKADEITSGQQELKQNPDDLTTGEQLIENLDIDDSIAEILVMAAAQPAVVVKPWTFIKNETYFSKLASMNPNAFAISGQGVIQSKPMTAKQIQTENKQRQRMKRGQNTYLASTGIAYTYDQSMIPPQLLSKKPDESLHLFGRQTASKSGLMVDSQTQPEDSHEIQHLVIDKTAPKPMMLQTGGTEEHDLFKRIIQTDQESDEMKMASPKQTETLNSQLFKKNSSRPLINMTNIEFPEAPAVKITDDQVEQINQKETKNEKPVLQPIAPLVEPKPRIQSGGMRLKKTVNKRLYQNDSGDLFMIHGMKLKTKQEKAPPVKVIKGQRADSKIKVRDPSQPAVETLDDVRKEVGESMNLKEQLNKGNEDKSPKVSPQKSDDDEDVTQAAFSAVKNSSL